MKASAPLDNGTSADEKVIDRKETDDTRALSSFGDASDEDGDGPIVYTDEELSAMRQVRSRLLEEHGIENSRVGLAFLAVSTINCKLRVDEAAEKIAKLLELMEKLGCPDGIDDALWKPEARHELHPYPPVGKDGRGCSTTWIRGKGRVPKEEERAHCHACVMQYLAVHADPRTLRNGVSFIIDLTGRDDAAAAKVGNEKLVQAFYQAIPMRPQIIMIAGCNVLMRTVVNASIKLASLFTKQKVLDRISFVSVESAVEYLPKGNAPSYCGGNAGGVENYEEWVKMRLEKLTVPKL